MTAYPTIRLVENELELEYSAAKIKQRKSLPEDAETLFSGWSREYGGLARNRNTPDRLLALGERMLASLPQVAEFLKVLIEGEALAPLIVEFGIERADESALANAFLDAPWELLAKNGRHLTLMDSVRFCPVRRIGKAGEPAQPSEYRLNIVFMAAAPRGYDNLDFENEEVALLAATQHLGLDFTCEESGTLNLLAKRVADELPDVVHLTCHGVLKPKPILLLEDEVGEREDVTPEDIVVKLPTSHLPRLFFSSACETAQADALLTPLTKHLIRAGAPAALGWAAPVLDTEATVFAASLYEKLTAGEELSLAMAGARYALLISDKLPQKMGAPSVSSDWHLARLLLGTKGGGALANARGASRQKYQGTALRSFLDERGEVPIASEQEFVGRRRYIQEMLKEFRAARPAHAGILLRGFGGQGKSSLAGRIAHRMEDSHRAIIVFGKENELHRYGAEAILGRFLDTYAKVEGIEAFKALREEVRNSPSRLEAALIRLLEDVCGQKGALPALLIIDDFEKILKAQSGSDHIVVAEYRDTIRAVIRAFATAVCDSRLLITSRYLFTLLDERGDLRDKLLDLPLPPMQERESQKQFFAKLRVSQKKRRSQAETITREQIQEILDVSEGVPRLQDILFTLALEDTQRCEACLAQMRAYRAEGTAPDEQALRTLFTNLTLDALLGLLNEPQRELLRASALFELPVPETVMHRLAELILPDSDAGTRTAAQPRLTALALWDAHEDLYDFQNRAYALHPLIRPRAGTLTEAEAKPLAAALCPVLLTVWGGKDGERPRLLNSEIARLALLAEQAEPLAITAVSRLLYLEDRFEYVQAAKEAVGILHVLDYAQMPPSRTLLRVAAERCHQVGDVKRAHLCRESALRSVQEARDHNEEVDEKDYAVLLLSHARALRQQGQLDEAQRHLEEALRTLEQFGDKRERAITLGDIAQIKRDKGQIDEALKLYQEQLVVYEQLVDSRSRAGTLSCVARILTTKGQVDEALKIHQAIISSWEELGEKYGRAVTMGDIARILMIKGQIDEALKLHQEQLVVYEQLGDKREWATTLGDMARILMAKGLLDEALTVHKEEIVVFKQLGDKHRHANTLGDIARILMIKGQIDEALKLYQEQLVVYEQLGDKRGRSVTLADIARILVTKGQVDEALKVNREALDICEQLRDADGIANTLWRIAVIQLARKQFQEAWENLQRSYTINTEIGRLDGICWVGIDWGQILIMAGRREEGIAVLIRSREGFEQLGQQEMAQQVQAFLDQIG